MCNRAPYILAAAGIAVALNAAHADVFKYVDSAGNVVFSDQPLRNGSLELEWKRTDRKLVAENRLQSEALKERQRAAAARLQARVAISDQKFLGRSPLWGKGSGILDADSSLQERRAHYHALISRVARQHRLLPELLHAVVRTESAYRADALSSAGACGLMQLMPGTAERFHVRDVWDPADNLSGGAAYLRWLLDFFQNDLRLALAAYNAGENAVKRHGNDIPPYPETQTYVRRVLRFLRAERPALRS